MSNEFARKTIIEYQSVSKVFRHRSQEVKALEDVDFRVQRKELFVIVGPSGCGKSTLLKMTAGLISPSSGQIVLDGNLVSKPASELGYVFQSPNLLPWRDVLGNVLLPVELRHLEPKKFLEKAKELIRIVGLSGFESRYPFQLSGGMQQRVAIARALIIDPAVILMDEPFGSLDAMTRDSLNFELIRIWEDLKSTIVLVTHGIEEAVLLADRIGVMTPRPGKLAKIVIDSLPRPRTRVMKYTTEYKAFVNEIENTLGLVS